MIWDLDEAGVIELPGGRRVRGRGLKTVPEIEPEFGAYLTWTNPRPPWPHRWVRWPDFGLPVRSEQARLTLVEAWERAGTELVEVACGGGRGRTGTALAALAMLDGLDRDAAIAWVRSGYDPMAVETPWQRWWLGRWEHGPAAG